MRRALKTMWVIGVLSLMVLAPLPVSAQRGVSSWSIQHRKKTKNQWKQLAIGSGAAGLLGLLTHDGTLTFLGTAGALYSSYRYEQDRKSENKLRRTRAAYFSRGYFYRNGRKYVRRTVYKDGKRYYQFVAAKR